LKLVDASAMRRIEEEAEKVGLSRLLMMENAGKAIAGCVWRYYDASLNPAVLVVAGTGNNGGDGVAAARHLATGAKVTVLLLGSMEKVKTEEAQAQWKMIKAVESMSVVEAPDQNRIESAKGLFDSSEVIVDAIFGTGVKGPVAEPQATAIKYINSSRALRIAVDVPSGLDPDTGADHGLVVKADVTVTLHAAKPGLVKRNDVVGRLVVEGIGIPE
jgi:hydroxyethylthiazole kinase-like uncharacterized protein yjeF